MKHGQTLTRWWQEYVLGRVMRPSHALALAEFLPGADPHMRFFGGVDPHMRFLAGADPHMRFLDGVEDLGGWTAPEKLRAPAHFHGNGILNQYDRADWQQVDRRLMRWSALFIEMARKRGVPLYVHSAFRTEAEQNEAVARGHSKARYPRSAHNNGEAVDIVHGTLAWQLSRQEWALLHVLGLRALDRVNADLPKAEKLQLTWGGDFKSLYDPAHWEISDYRARIKRRPTLAPVRLTPRAILSRIKF